MTPRLVACLAAINSYWSKHHQAPTREELGDALGICKVSAHLLVERLHDKGLVDVYPRIWRNVELTEDGARVLETLQ